MELHLCPACSNFIKRDWTQCKSCGAELPAIPEPEPVSEPAPNPAPAPEPAPVSSPAPEPEPVVRKTDDDSHDSSVDAIARRIEEREAQSGSSRRARSAPHDDDDDDTKLPLPSGKVLIVIAVVIAAALAVAGAFMQAGESASAVDGETALLQVLQL